MKKVTIICTTEAAKKLGLELDREVECPCCRAKFFESELLQPWPNVDPCECPKCEYTVNPNFPVYRFLTTGEARLKR